MTSCQRLSPCESYDLRLPFRVFAPKKSFSPPPCSIPCFIRPRNWKHSISGAGNVELHFRQIKTMLGMDVLRCLTPEMVLKELAMHRIAYNLIRALMQRAAITYDITLERISFKGSLDSLHHYADAIYATHRKPRKQAQLFDALLRTIASDLVPRRPERSEPRARKRRPKDYQLLTKPRKEMCTTSHRNRPKNKS